MRLLIVIAGLLLNVGAQASQHACVAANHTCAELRTMVRARGAIAIVDSNGTVTVYANQMACYENGMASKFEVVQAKDKLCVAGLSCAPYSSGM
jgi:hypothetical protein